MTRFEHELADLRQHVLEMGALAQTMISDSWLGIVRQDRALVDRVLASRRSTDSRWRSTRKPSG